MWLAGCSSSSHLEYEGGAGKLKEPGLRSHTSPKLPCQFLDFKFGRRVGEREREGGREGGREGERERVCVCVCVCACVY